MSGLNRDYDDKRNAPYYPVWLNMTQAERDDRARYVAARDWAGLFLKYPRTEANWGGWTIPKSNYEFAGFDAEGNKVHGANFKNRGIPLSLFSYRYVNGKRVYVPFTESEIREWFEDWAAPVPGDEPDPAVKESHLKNVLAAQKSVASRASNPGDVEVNVPRFGPTFSVSEYLTVKKPKFGKTLVKVAAVVAASVVGGVVLGKAAGAVMGKIGAATGAATTGVTTTATAARTASVVKAVNNASKIYKIAKTASDIRKTDKMVSKVGNEIRSQATFLKIPEPPYSPVPASVNDPAYRELTIAQAMQELEPAMKDYTQEQRADVYRQVVAEVDDLIARANEAGAANLVPQPSSALSTDAKMAQADSAEQDLKSRQMLPILFGVGALVLIAGSKR